ncbi:COG4626 Phage terminase-like protein, large subunit [uncultured Caudovirales phage]|uniref:COG4626 Phage terminase-like protein, large subunit n=1 Tax=uncultured Caudovirales phage TaxID=2100421 RepID=A0A6J5M7P4_9CAUD|nr:COG4626 Phage terminase-like protein, large subunit [uncultured Caudovirales phage]
MTSHAGDSKGLEGADNVSNRLLSVLGRDTESVFGSSTPRIHTPLNDLPSRGLELVDLASTLSIELMPWQKFFLEHAHKVKPDGRWATPVAVCTVARQNGKSFLMQLRILGGLFLWNESLQIGSAHRLSTSLEQFRQLVSVIEGQDHLAKQVKRIRWTHGSEEIETVHGTRFIVKAGGSAARGVSKPETIHLDELREMNDLESFASLRYTLMAAKNPQIISYTNAGDATSVVLNSFRDRALASIAGGADDIGYFEWSAPTDDVHDQKNWLAANPAIGHTINIDNIKAVLNDPHDVVMTEVLCRWVQSIQSCVGSTEWAACADEDFDLDPEKLTWLGLDLSPDRKFAALVGAQKIGNDEEFGVKLLHTWSNDVQLDDKAIANDLAPYARKYPLEYLLYSRRTSGAVASRLVPAGIPIFDMDGAYPQACDEMLGAINSGRLHHRPNKELTAQMLSAVQLRRGDGGWVIGRRASQSAVCASVATALVTHFATRPESDLDIMVG